MDSYNYHGCEVKKDVEVFTRNQQPEFFLIYWLTITYQQIKLAINRSRITRLFKQSFPYVIYIHIQYN